VKKPHPRWFYLFLLFHLQIGLEERNLHLFSTRKEFFFPVKATPVIEEKKSANIYLKKYLNTAIKVINELGINIFKEL